MDLQDIIGDSNQIINLTTKVLGVASIGVGVVGFVLTIADLVPGDEPIGIGWMVFFVLVGLVLLGLGSYIPKLLGMIK